MEITGRCFCGRLSYRARGPFLWAALCHCEDCRRIASADYVSWFGVARANIHWTGERALFSSSSGVERSFCPTCGTPMSFETEAFPDETHLYAQSLDDPALYRPDAHIFWSARSPWFSRIGHLPHHDRELQDAATDGESLP